MWTLLFACVFLFFSLVVVHRLAHCFFLLSGGLLAIHLLDHDGTSNKLLASWLLYHMHRWESCIIARAFCIHLDPVSDSVFVLVPFGFGLGSGIGMRIFKMVFFWVCFASRWFCCLPITARHCPCRGQLSFSLNFSFVLVSECRVWHSALTTLPIRVPTPFHFFSFSSFYVLNFILL